MKKSLRGFFLVALVLSVFMTIGCGGGGSSSSSSGSDGDSSTATINGTVLDYSTGNGIEGATVTVANKTATTNASGEYSITEVGADDHIPVNVSADDFLETSQIASIASDETEVSITLKMIPVTYTETFDPTLAKTVLVPSTVAYVAIDANSLVKTDAKGATKAPTGDVSVDMTIIDPTADPEIMPGDFTAINTSGGDDVIESFGAMGVTFTDSTGDELNLQDGDIATIRIPVAAQSGVTPPATMPLYYYNNDLGKWVEEGTATLNAAQTYYEGTVEHFSTWNADIPMTTTNITGCVQDINGDPVANAIVKLRGKDYTGTSSARTNSAGEFTIAGKTDAISIINASTSNAVTNTIEFSTVGGNDEITSCLVLIEDAITIKLTWGTNPSDLDSHMYTPDGTHIYYVNQGNIAASPFIGLDVDDTSSYGPEVVTVVNFEEVGTYRYAVNHFAGSGDIASSPAKVELSWSGGTQLFTPPSGTPNTSWNVFNIVVDSNRDVTIEPVNTWSSDFLGKVMRKK